MLICKNSGILTPILATFQLNSGDQFFLMSEEPRLARKIIDCVYVAEANIIR